jgi:hypothetical protein
LLKVSKARKATLAITGSCFTKISSASNYPTKKFYNIGHRSERAGLRIRQCQVKNVTFEYGKITTKVPQKMAEHVSIISFCIHHPFFRTLERITDLRI